MKTRALRPFIPIRPFVFAAALCAAVSASADTVYITARPAGNPSPAGANFDGTYTELIAGSDVGAASSAIGSPSRNGARYFFNSTFTNSVNTGDPFLRLTPTLGSPGGIYQLHYTHSSTAANTTQDAITGFSNAANCTLSFTNTDKFQRRYGAPAPQAWQFLGYVTNDPGSTTPTIELYLRSHTNINSSTARFIVDCFRFTLDEPCLYVPTVSVVGPLGASVPSVVVAGVSNAATKVTVYQDTGTGMVAIGSKTTGITGGDNIVTVTGLVKGARVAATQTLVAQEGCVPTAGTLVGGGANPRLRVALSIRETPSNGPAGAAGATTDSDIHFLGATTRIGGAPGDGTVVTPATDWQTLTFDAGWRALSNVVNVSGATVNEAAYAANDAVSIKVYATKTFSENGATIFSPVGGASPIVTSNDVFSINWTWTAVTNAEGYRLIRTNHLTAAVDAADVIGTNFFADANNAWTAATTVTPTNTQVGPTPSVKWNLGTGTPVGTQNDLATRWGIVEAIAFAIDDLEDTGPYDLYLDNIQNGGTNWQTFETVPANQTDYAFRAPNFSPTTSANILSAPNTAIVSSGAADTGAKSLRVRFQWADVTSSRWLRLTTSGVGNPMVNLEEPITLRILLQPPGASPVAPNTPAPTLSVQQLGGQTVLNWSGAHRLQASTNVAGGYANVLQPFVPPNTNAYFGPYTNGSAEPVRFFRLVD